jgi:hypothetical protein
MAQQIYIMSPDLFKQFSSTNEFLRINGATYQEHIARKLDNILLEEQKSKILNAHNDAEALKLLQLYCVNYTHYY